LKIVNLHAGLGNQLYIYVYFRWLQERCTDDECIVNSSIYDDPRYAKYYGMGRAFGVTFPRLRDKFSPAAWDEIRKQSENVHMVTLLERLGLGNFSIVSESVAYEESFANVELREADYRVDNGAYNKESADIKGNVWYHGYWHTTHYYRAAFEAISKELEFTPVTDDFNKRMIDTIDSVNSVAVHIRTYSHADGEEDAKFGLGKSFYYYAVNKMRSYLDKPTWFVFTDNLDRVQKSLADYGFIAGDKIVVVDGNSGDNDFRDMQLMSLCKHMVMPNSSFSMSAAMLNKNTQKLIIRPNRYLDIF
jgi:hypothetical protein